jgi:hypothetical protein
MGLPWKRNQVKAVTAFRPIPWTFVPFPAERLQSILLKFMSEVEMSIQNKGLTMETNSSLGSHCLCTHVLDFGQIAILASSIDCS